MDNRHKHHIIPKYRCIELGIDPEFEDNYAYPTRLQHANIHWGYMNHDLSPLLEICNPPQYVIDMIPLGDYRDSSAAVFLAMNEIDGIVNVKGNAHPDYKPVIDLDGNEVDGSEDWSYGTRWYHRRMYSQGKNPISHEERRVKREKKKKEKKRLAEERRKRQEEDRRIAKEQNKTFEAVRSLRYYHKQKERGIDPNKKYRESHREENKAYAKWYYRNVQKPKNLLKKQNAY